MICWPQTGHANLNSLIASAPTIPHQAAGDNAYLWQGKGLACRAARRSRVAEAEGETPAPLFVFGSDFDAASAHIRGERSA